MEDVKERKLKKRKVASLKNIMTENIYRRELTAKGKLHSPGSQTPIS